MAETEDTHLVVFSSQFWGHARPLSTFIARLVKLRPVLVTFLALNSLHQRVQAEIARDFHAGEEHLAHRIRIIGLKDGSQTHETSGAPGDFRAAWEKLCNKEPLLCAKTGSMFDSLPVRPRAVLLDFLSVDAYDNVREVSGYTVRVYAWYASATLAFFQNFCEDRLDVVNAEVVRTGEPFDDVAHRVFTAFTGRLVDSPCMPTMHDYEMHPQALALIRKSRSLPPPSRYLKQVNGIVTFDAADYCPRATTALREWLGKNAQKAFYAGPLLPSGEKSFAIEKTSSLSGDEILVFLNEKFESRGERSVLYISFGSLFWPGNPAKLWAVLEVIMERNIPFVMSHAAKFAGPIPDDVKAKLAAYKNAIIADWVAQQALLEHPAIGWFLTHGGLNGTLESIIAGVPMIVWPMAGDQPMNAIYLSEEADIAYELIEVRHGVGSGKIYRNGYTPVGTIDAVKEEVRTILDKAFGADGAEKRMRLQGLRRTLQAAWGEDGIARSETAAFLDDLKAA
ncbi:UDP-Glycosyltransferase/glycogen phosphorylase [Trametes gibbosa]|nr:UDP-Glycosyltransferase/glycogen phosphorylase [Trametes gibbosa]